MQSKRLSITLAFLIVACLSVAGLSSCAGGTASTQAFDERSAETASKASAETATSTGSGGQRPSNRETTGSSSSSTSSTAEDGSSSVTGKSAYADANGDVAYIPQGFTVSEKEGERTISTGLVVVGPDGSEYVWVPATQTALAARDFGSYFSGGDDFSRYCDDTSLEAYLAMAASVEKYGGFYIGRYEASKGADGLPASKRVSAGEPGSVWVQFSPQDTVAACEQLYTGNDTV